MRGRDPREKHRVSTPLELLFDLTFVLAFGAASSELAHALAEGHIWAGIGAFAFAIFSVSWAWIHFAWFASAYDTDDWVYRLTTMLQMVGVLILALGLPAMFESFGGPRIDNRVMVLGYVVMRIPMCLQWWRASHQDPRHRLIARYYIGSIVISQILWCLLLLVADHPGLMFALATVPLAIELAGPVVAQRKQGGPPWHAHHIAERYSLVIIIALGEGLVGTLATLSAIVGPEGPGWSLEVAVLGLAGTALTFGMWWIYFVIPSGPLLEKFRGRSFGWGYGHIALFGATVAVGAGLHVAAYSIEHHCALSLPETVLCTVVPVALFIATIYALYSALTHSFDPHHVWMIAGSGIVIVATVVCACAGIGLVWCIALLAVTPWVSVVGYEWIGHRHNAAVLHGLESSSASIDSPTRSLDAS